MKNPFQRYAGNNPMRMVSRIFCGIALVAALLLLTGSFACVLAGSGGHEAEELRGGVGGRYCQIERSVAPDGRVGD
jgi:hypothetical protein